MELLIREEGKGLIKLGSLDIAKKTDFIVVRLNYRLRLEDVEKIRKEIAGQTDRDVIVIPKDASISIIGTE